MNETRTLPASPDVDPRDDDAVDLAPLIAAHGPVPELRAATQARAEALVRAIREEGHPSIMEKFLGEYGLSSEEGVALMCLAEALLRVPDAATIDDLIEDKIAGSRWDAHLGQSESSLVNASTWGLYLTGAVLREERSGSLADTLRGAVRRLGEPVIRTAVTRAIREMGRQFVLGTTIEGAMSRARGFAARGYTFSYDMLGEAAMTDADALRYHASYAHAIAAIAAEAGGDIRDAPGISVKLSALHPRYETRQRETVMATLVPRLASLVHQAKEAGIGLNIDAEEDSRLDLSLDVIENVVADEALAGWDGFGVVIQAYNRRAAQVIDRVHAMAERHDRRIMVRLVKGAYWDTEIKHAQVTGLDRFPVWVTKPATDASYLCCARKLLGCDDRIYPQFATHNAHTVAAVQEYAEAAGVTSFEFQRLHGMGEALYDHVLKGNAHRCRVYAPVGHHRDLLAYLVRRLLENGANSSFVNQIFDASMSPAEIAADPFAAVEAGLVRPARIQLASELFAPARRNSRGWDLDDPETVDLLAEEVARRAGGDWHAGEGEGTETAVLNPATGERVGTAIFATADAARAAVAATRPWDAPVEERAAALERAADLYEANAAEIFARCTREAGKTLLDGVAELREAVDFLRYYAAEARRLDAAGETVAGRGVFACISPWNFPLAIFTGQIAAALAAGNGVVAKPAETTPLTAALGVALMHEAGVPADVLRLVPGTGAEVGAALAADPGVAGLAFTGSTATAKRIEVARAEAAPGAPLIAETGGLNAMVVDSTALPEQAVRDIVASAFQSAGQRCSAARILYVQDEVADDLMAMLFGAMEALVIGDPVDPAVDVGPVIDETALAKIAAHVEAARASGRLLRQVDPPDLPGTFAGPAAIAVSGIEDLEEEIFGPVLHIARYRAEDLDRVVDAINAKGYGLTFGMHSRITDRIEQVVARISVGNVYVNRNQIGAIVGSQPFGGHGLSGTGPKAGGPRYLPRFTAAPQVGLPAETAAEAHPEADPQRLAGALAALAVPALDPAGLADLPGPTGESNRYGTVGRGPVLCLGPGAARAEEQAAAARAAGAAALAAAPGSPEIDGHVAPEALTALPALAAVVYEGDDPAPYARALAARQGPIVPLLTGADFARWCVREVAVSVDTTAAGGNADLLAG
ncbi:bifunctional proline dehydrogenase/L-glutamate gamma-semialdehyde dehydrogenase PutA [Rhodovulum sp. 12E13]|uniref:bifunctional proline dehydrogenase/L-glutamate gamma-semialdehyde dehydrogenase PutA n=1 Tax=Rhodovulum sp. 12E13 TaxID=2203891 RepID=UPI000E12F839|nr:bifunctional proline dehydrogenase/L-glutamate gamma-semialdehyde dehydrogenase PutA [Rhodovulum sp. 12E13]RDC74548.1 bifunctional proline dehydrogenase/L-glutamate gamma-semialdehyde dehydrogenase PutA [Rhodovulum sp. 12E13]